MGDQWVDFLQFQWDHDFEEELWISVTFAKLFREVQTSKEGDDDHELLNFQSWAFSIENKCEILFQLLDLLILKSDTRQ